MAKEIDDLDEDFDPEDDGDVFDPFDPFDDFEFDDSEITDEQRDFYREALISKI